MLTDELAAALRAATEHQPFTPDPSVALARARRMRLRRRVTVSAGALGMITVVGAGLPPLLGLGSGDVVTMGPRAGGGVQRTLAPGALPFTVEEDRAAEAQPGAASCALNLVLGSDATPARIGLPCEPAAYDPDAYASPSDVSTDGRSASVGAVSPPKLWAPFSRQDYVSLGGRRRLVTSGTAPKGTVAVTAVDAGGHPLSATLVRPHFTDLVVFAMQSEGSHVMRLRYLLADGRQSEENNVSTP